MLKYMIMWAVITLGAVPAWSAVPPAQLLQQGIQSYEQARFKHSLRLLQDAAGQTNEPQLLARIKLYIGLNEVVLGQIPLAQRSFEQALSHDPLLALDPRRFKSSVIDLFHRVRSKLQGKLVVLDIPPEGQVRIDGKPSRGGPLPIGQHRIALHSKQLGLLFAKSAIVYHQRTTEVELPRLGWLTVRSDVPGAEVLVDGRLVGLTPTEKIGLLPGPHKVQVNNRAGTPRKTFRAAPTIAADRHAVVRARFGAVETRTPPATAVSKDHATDFTWAWVSAGGAVVSLATALTLNILARSQHSEWEELLQRAVDGEVEVSQADADRFDELERSGKRLEVGSAVLFSVAGALALTAGLLALLPKRASRERTSGLGVINAPHQLGLSWHTQF